jgi:ABC-type transport system involved in multi-copper enzyme maturation permease subunit
MTTLNLLRGEILKARKQNINLILLLGVNMAAVLFLGWTITMAKVYPKTYFGDAEFVLPYPNNVIIAIRVISFFASLLAIMFVSNSVGSEYNQDTWKMILPRYGSRIKFITTKLVVGLIAMVILYTVGIGFWLGLSSFGYWFLGLQPGTTAAAMAQLDAKFSLANGFKTVGLEMLSMCFYGSLALLATIAARSVSSGMLVGMAGSLVLATVSTIPYRALALCLPSLHLSNMLAHWANSAEQLRNIKGIFDNTVSPILSLAVVLGYILFMIATSLVIFHRRDLAG